MSANVMVEIICDGCDATVTEWHTTPAKLRKHLNAYDGWVFIKGDDFCTSCARTAVPRTSVLRSVREAEVQA